MAQRSSNVASLIDVEFGVQTHIRSRGVFQSGLSKNTVVYKPCQRKPSIVQKMPVYEEMAKRLSNL